MELIIYAISSRQKENQTEKLVIDPTLDFDKRLDVHSLNNKFGKHFQKSMILKPSEIEIFWES